VEAAVRTFFLTPKDFDPIFPRPGAARNRS